MGVSKYRDLYCTYCDRRMIPGTSTSPTKDHVHPASKGGVFTILACHECNWLKGDLAADDWQEFMQKNPRWWKKAG
jgi:5-methylcytosine-specific restriction endonuclease McrA